MPPTSKRAGSRSSKNVRGNSSRRLRKHAPRRARAATHRLKPVLPARKTNRQRTVITFADREYYTVERRLHPLVQRGQLGIEIRERVLENQEVSRILGLLDVVHDAGARKQQIGRAHV